MSLDFRDFSQFTIECFASSRERDNRLCVTSFISMKLNEVNFNVGFTLQFRCGINIRASSGNCYQHIAVIVDSDPLSMVRQDFFSKKITKAMNGRAELVFFCILVESITYRTNKIN